MNWSKTSNNNKKNHIPIHSCFGSRSLVGLSLATVLPSWIGLLPLGAAQGPKGVTRSHGDRSSQLGQQRHLSPDLKEGAATRMWKDPEGHEEVTEQRCSSLLSQGYPPGLTHVRIVETPRHEAPLCPVPPCAGGVTTIAPGERGSSSSSSLLRAIPVSGRQGKWSQLGLGLAEPSAH